MNQTMNSTDSVKTAQSYTQGVTAGRIPEDAVGRSRTGHDVTEAEPAPVLSPPEMQKAVTTTPAYKKGATIGQRLACPFATAGNLLVRTICTTVQRAAPLAFIPGALVGGIAGAAVSIPVAGVVKLYEMLARTNTNRGLRVILCSSALAGLMGGFTTERIGALAGTLAGTGLSIVGGLIGFGKGVRDAVKGDVHRLEREKLTLHDFFEQYREYEVKTEKEVAAGVDRVWRYATMAKQPDSPTVPLESPLGLSTGNQNFSTANLALQLKDGAAGAA